MKTLTFDTSLDKTFVTLFDGEKMLASEIIENHNEKYHSAYLIPAIVEILKKNNLTMKDINVIGTNVGPGSFTGIRACVTVARVIAQQLEIPLVGISSLEILSKINKTDKRTITVLDARKNQYYTAVFEKGNVIQQPVLTDAQDVLKYDFSNAIVIADKASEEFLNSNGISSILYNSVKEDLGVILNNIVRKRLKTAANDEYYWSKLKPLYLQAPPVTISQKSK